MPGPPGPPGCGLDAAAFCDPFNAPASSSRAGELDHTRWSGSRLYGTGQTADGYAFPIRSATIRPFRHVGDQMVQLPACRNGLPDRVLVDQDTLICDPSGDIKSNHLLVAASAQNYGENSYRIRQPFDFAGRTGKIVFDAEAFDGGQGGLGYVTLDVTEDPIPAPGYAEGGYPNSEGSVIPRNGFVLVLNGDQGAVLRSIMLFTDFVEKDIETDSMNVIPVAVDWGKLNHFEVKVSQSRIEVYASPASSDGVTFDPPKLVYGADVDLPFSRGYVHITTHNHATLKYTNLAEHGENAGFATLDAWVARWDNVGFDGPVIDGYREYSVDDSLVPADNVPAFDGQKGMAIGWMAPDLANGSSQVLTIHDVDTTGMAKARFAISAYLNGTTPEDFDVLYRVNGKPWHDRKLTANEVLHAKTPAASNGIWGLLLDVPIGELQAGDNTVEFATKGLSQGYPEAVANVDLVLSQD
jgi:hypothetical protein